MVNKKMSLNDKVNYLKDNIKIIDRLIIELKSKIINNSKNMKIDVIIFLFNYYSDKKNFFVQALLQLYAIVNGNIKNKKQFFIECWEKEFDNLYECGEFDYKITNVNQISYKKVK